MTPAELARKVRAFQILSTKEVMEALAGKYRSVFRGRGLEFEEVREYQPGDDVRLIDQNVSARMGRPFIKVFREEKDLTIVLLVDLSASGRFGSRGMAKSAAAAETCAFLAFAGIRNNARVGLVLFTDRVERFIPPGRGVRHAFRIITEIISLEPAGTGTDIAGALGFVGRVYKKRTVLFVVSDFLDSGFEKPLRILARRHDLIAVSVSDPLEASLPNAGLLELEDAETGEPVLVDTGSPTVRSRFETLCLQRRLELKGIFNSAGIHEIRIATDGSFLIELVKFFKLRRNRRPNNH
jgi:uncharacterized protein (DUF58 family)